MNVFQNTLFTGLVSASLLLPATSSIAEGESGDGGFSLPSAKSGECYGRVAVPATYETESVNVVVRQATQEIVVTEPVFENATESVMIQEASSKLEVVEPVYEVVEHKELIQPARLLWVRNSPDSEVPASSGMLADLEASGVDLNTVETGRCFYEYYKPAVFREEEDQVLVEQETELLDVEPASFSTADKQVMLSPASKRLVVVPTVFETREEQVLVEPEHSEWQVGRGPIEKIDNLTGEIMCRVDIPARYETVKTEVVSAPARTTALMEPAKFDTIEVRSLAADAQELRTPVPARFETFKRSVLETEEQLVWMPEKVKDSDSSKATGNVVCRIETDAVYQTFERKVVKQPGSFARTEVPAEYKNVEVRRLVSEAVVSEQPVPEQSQTFERRIKVADSRMEWRPVLCETNVTQDVIRKIQSALNGRGYEAGTVDGLLGNGTKRALDKFQEDEKLAKGGLTYATIEALGIDL